VLVIILLPLLLLLLAIFQLQRIVIPGERSSPIPPVASEILHNQSAFGLMEEIEIIFVAFLVSLVLLLHLLLPTHLILLVYDFFLTVSSVNYDLPETYLCRPFVL
jgi:hypothetical protein